MNKDLVLRTEKQLEIRFNEVDMMNVVWHGTYPAYLEDAREAFGAQYGLSYHRYIKETIFAPIVEMDIKYRKPLHYGMTPTIEIVYVPTEAAKIIFDYKIYDKRSGEVFVTARTTQVFMDTDYKLMWFAPQFYTDWQKEMKLI